MILFRDISSWQRGMKIPAGSTCIVAKATEGLSFADPCYRDFEAQSAAAGVSIFSPYHFLHAAASMAEQAVHHFEVVGARTTMLDVEPLDGSRPGVADALNFMDQFERLGGSVWGVYFPRWYWEEIGGDLRELQEAGACLIASDYSGGYDPTARGWQRYGGVAPAILQYSRSVSAPGGYATDMNAFPGTLAQLRALIMGDSMLTPKDFWGYRGLDGGAGGPDDPDVHQSLLTTRDGVAKLQETAAEQDARLTAVETTLQKIADKLGV